MTETNNKLRAVFLAALMFLAVFAGSVALAGSAAADHETAGDAAWSGGQTYYQGQTLRFNTNESGQFELHDADAGVDDTYVRDLAFREHNDTRYALIDTSDLRGDYEIRNDNGTAVTAPVTIREQILDAQWSPSSTDGDSTLDIASNRNDYEVEVTSENLDRSELRTIFTEREGTTDTGVVLNASDDNQTQGNFEDIAAGEYEFQLNVVDTTANDTATITVEDDIPQSVTFDESVSTQEEGDTVTISLETQEVDEFDLQVGSDDMGYNVTIEGLTPDDDGQVELEMNSYLAGTGNESAAWDYAADDRSLNDSQVTRNSDEVPDRLEAGLYDLSAEGLNEDEEEVEWDVAALDLTERSTDGLTVYTASSEAADLNTIQDGMDADHITETDEVAEDDYVLLEIEASGIFGAIEDAGGIQNVLNDNNGLNLTVELTNPGPNQGSYEVDLSDAAFTPDEENDTFYVSFQMEEDAGDEFDASFTATEDYDYTGDAESVDDSFSVVERTGSLDVDGDGYVTVEPAEGQTISGETSVAPGTDLRVRTRATGESPFLKSQSATVDADGAFAADFDFSDVSEGQEFTVTALGANFAEDVEAPGRVASPDPASVSVSDQEAEETGDVVTVDSVYLPDGGYVTIHDDSWNDGASFDSVRGTSDYLSEGEHQNVEIQLDDSFDVGDHTVVAMPHQDTNDNQEYDFLDSDGENDGAYMDSNEEAITDSATLSVVEPEEEPTPTETEEPADDDGEEPTDTATDTDEPDDQPGFGAVVALIALLGAALLAARRNDF